MRERNVVVKIGGGLLERGIFTTLMEAKVLTVGWKKNILRLNLIMPCSTGRLLPG
jgi:hypothetical protein